MSSSDTTSTTIHPAVMRIAVILSELSCRKETLDDRIICITSDCPCRCRKAAERSVKAVRPEALQ